MAEDSYLSLVLWFPVLLSLRLFNIGLTILTAPTFFILRRVFGMEIKSMSFWDTSIRNRKQTLAVTTFVFLIPFSLVCHFIGFSFFIFPITTIPMFIYYIFIYRDKAPSNGSRKPFMRYWKVWRHFADYFPLTLIKTSTLDPSNKYVFCYHPHGVISVGAFGNFATHATGFNKKFPGIDIRVLTLATNFFAPFTREILLWMGMCSASRKSCDTILQRGPGSAIMLVVGGAQESIDAAPGTYRLTLSRQGFVRVALDNNARLVPVLGFGETDIFDTYVYGENSFIRHVQVKVKELFGFTLPVFHGRGMFNYTFGFLPYRKQIVTIVGPPIDLPTVPERLKGRNLVETEEGRRLVDQCHKLYIKGLIGLYQDFKNTNNISRSESLRINGNFRSNTLSLRERIRR